MMQVTLRSGENVQQKIIGIQSDMTVQMLFDAAVEKFRTELRGAKVTVDGWEYGRCGQLMPVSYHPIEEVRVVYGPL